MKDYLLLSATILSLLLVLFFAFRVPETDGFIGLAISTILFIILFGKTMKNLWDVY
ncbi:hypothetical protein ACT3CE_18335 [Marinifilum sp. RC60d5]|uniref:hypothetical protein n=1 Tax=Marinifilum sp. RC60d5 TaxID=3458414 RepID=UPI0040352B05